MRTKRDKEIFGINLLKVKTNDQKKLDDFIDDFTTRYSDFLNAGIDLREVFEAEWEMVLKGKEPFRMLTTYYSLDKKLQVQIINRYNNKAVVHVLDMGKNNNDDFVDTVDVYEDERGEHLRTLGDWVTSYGYPKGYHKDEEDDE